MTAEFGVFFFLVEKLMNLS